VGLSRRFTIVTVALTASVAFLMGLMIAGQFTSVPAVSTAPRPLAEPATRTLSPTGFGTPSALVNFADVAERINAAVVNIDATSKATTGARVQRFSKNAPVPDEPGDGAQNPDVPRQGSGSGFVIDRDGYVLTNNHVIDAADRITVTLADGRAFRAEVVGTDPAIDVALLKIPADADLPEAPLGNSDELRAGEWVCAIGNPLGYVHSVTVGVVSFIGRKLFDQSLDDYIQTDAAINFGNSGGPLINARGQVIGINSAISSKASSIGFAVPINQAVAILPQLKTRGRVSRGFIGVTLTDVTPGLQRALGLSVLHGAMVQDVGPQSPAERAGLRPYDVIVQIDGRAVLTNEELIRDVSARQPGTVAKLEVLRENRRHVMPIKLAERPRRGYEFEGLPDSSLSAPAAPRSTEPDADPPLGISVRELDRGVVGRFEVPDSVHGVVVTRVEPTGPANQILRRNFVILEINRRATPTVSEYERLVSAARPGDVVAVYYYDPQSRQRALATITVE
jgi:serine protease Do